MASGIEFQQELKLRTIFCFFTQNIVFDSKMFSPAPILRLYYRIMSREVNIFVLSFVIYFCPQSC